MTILAIAWASIILVGWYIHWANKFKWGLYKPFSCERCLSFWISLSYFYLTGVDKYIIFALVTSLITTLIHITIKKLT